MWFGSRRREAVERPARSAALLYLWPGSMARRLHVSEFDPAKLLIAAVIDQARKHRKRPPDEVERLQEHRRARPR
jgi:hypothetical protein